MSNIFNALNVKNENVTAGVMHPYTGWPKK